MPRLAALRKKAESCGLRVLRFDVGAKWCDILLGYPDCKRGGVMRITSIRP